MRYMPLQRLTMRSCEQKCNKIVGCANVTTAVIVWTSATCQDTTPHLVYSGSTPQGGAGQSCNSSLATAISTPQQSFSIHHSWAITLLQQQSVQSRQPNQTVYKGFKSWTQLLMFAPVSFVACHNSYLAFHKAQSKWITQLESPERAERCMLRSDVLGNLAVVSPWYTKRCRHAGECGGRRDCLGWSGRLPWTIYCEWEQQSCCNLKIGLTNKSQPFSVPANSAEN